MRNMREEFKMKPKQRTEEEKAKEEEGRPQKCDNGTIDAKAGELLCTGSKRQYD